MRSECGRVTGGAGHTVYLRPTRPKRYFDKNNAVCQSLANGNLTVTATQLPTMSTMIWRRRRHEMPRVMMAVMMIDGSTVHMSAWRRHSNSGDCDSRKSGDEFDLVHGMVPFDFRASQFSRLPSQFSRLHRVRIVLSIFLTKLF